VLVCHRGRWLGRVDDSTLQQLPVQRWDTDHLGDHLQPMSSMVSIREDAPIWQAVQTLEDSGASRLLVLSPAGLPSGTLERPELGQAVFERLGVKLPAVVLQAARRHNTYPLGLALPQVVRGLLASGEVSEAQAPSASSTP
jgi:hypothetical protein